MFHPKPMGLCHLLNPPAKLLPRRIEDVIRHVRQDPGRGKSLAPRERLQGLMKPRRGPHPGGLGHGLGPNVSSPRLSFMRSQEGWFHTEEAASSSAFKSAANRDARAKSLAGLSSSTSLPPSMTQTRSNAVVSP